MEIEKYIRVELGEWEYLQEISDSRLELLREIHDRCQNKGWCPFCTMLEVDTFLGHEHGPDCKIANAL